MRGRPPTGVDPLVGVRFPRETITQIDTWAKVNATSRSDAVRRLVDAALRHRVTINEKLDEALDKSFPASDPVSLGHSDHVGQPKSVRKKSGYLPKG
jgi:hypothetical protein